MRETDVTTERHKTGGTQGVGVFLLLLLFLQDEASRLVTLSASEPSHHREFNIDGNFERRICIIGGK